jgi:predicted DNA-binding transcriptional regulator AlpA
MNSTGIDVVLVTTKEMAKLLGISEKTLRNDRSRKHLGIPYIKLGTKIVRYSPVHAQHWVEAKIVRPEQRPRRGRPPKVVQVARERSLQSSGADPNKQ